MFYSSPLNESIPLILVHKFNANKNYIILSPTLNYNNNYKLFLTNNYYIHHMHIKYHHEQKKIEIGGFKVVFIGHGHKYIENFSYI